MSFRVLLALLFAMTTASAVADVPLTGDEEAALKIIFQGSHKFAINLYKELIKTKSGNVFVSPLSVQMVLALAYTGAEGVTASELKSLLSLPDNLNQTHSGYQSLIKTLQDPVLKMANRLFVENTLKVKQDFQNNAQKYFLAPADLLEFQADPEKSREHINLWVENQTNKKIRDIIPAGLINSDTRMILVNAIHFKAKWKQPFDENDTHKRDFHVSKTEKKKVYLMQNSGMFGFSKSKQLKSKILMLNYKGRHFRMIVILPNKVDGLAELEEKLDTVDLLEELNHLQPTQLLVKLPVFNMRKTVDLKPLLTSMGVKTMFGPSADFSKMSEEPLYVSEVFQKSFVSVTAQGTKAYAATAMDDIPLSSDDFGPPEQVFIADHPFLFAIMHKSSKTTLFLGRFTGPE